MVLQLHTIINIMMNKCNHNVNFIGRYSFPITLLDIPRVVVIWPIRSRYVSYVRIKALLSVLGDPFYYRHQPLKNFLTWTRKFFPPPPQLANLLTVSCFSLMLTSVVLVVADVSSPPFADEMSFWFKINLSHLWPFIPKSWLSFFVVTFSLQQTSTTPNRAPNFISSKACLAIKYN